jgi:nucleotide-binding universal stress UspA family protein
MFKTIIWATDGSDVADGSLPAAKALAGYEGGRLVVVHANEVLIGRAGDAPVLADEPDLQRKIEGQVNVLRDAGYDATFALATGAPHNVARLIADVAREIGADMIVVGSRGRSTIAGLLVGSVTHRLLHIAPCPVLAVPPAERMAREPEREHAAVADRRRTSAYNVRGQVSDEQVPEPALVDDKR